MRMSSVELSLLLSGFLAWGGICAAGETAKLTPQKLHYKIEELAQEQKNDEIQQLLRDQSALGNGRADIILGLKSLLVDDAEAAKKYFRQAVAKGCIEGNYYLAIIIYQEGSDQSKNLEAFKLVKPLADKNIPEACYMVAQMYLQGHGVEENQDLAVKYYAMAAEHTAMEYDTKERQFSINSAKIITGMSYYEKSEWEKAYEFLEDGLLYGNADTPRAAAWRTLGIMYMNGSGIEKPRPDWAELCFKAAHRLEPTAVTEFNLALCAAEQGKTDEMLKWAKAAADHGSKHGKALLNDKEYQEQVNKKRAEIEQQQVAESPLKQSTRAYFEQVNKVLLGSDLDQLDKISSGDAKDMRMVRFPARYQLKGWTYDERKVLQELDKELFADRNGCGLFITDEFLENPIEANLAALNPTIRAINNRFETAVCKTLENPAFRKLSSQELLPILERMNKQKVNNLPGIYKSTYILDCEDIQYSAWQIRENLYFVICADFSGRWQMRYYSFISCKNGVYTSLVESGSPIDINTAATIAGILQGDLDSLNNLAVELEEGDIDTLEKPDEEVEKILQTLADTGHWGGTYNLGVFYLKQGKTDQGRKYLKEAAAIRQRQNGQ